MTANAPLLKGWLREELGFDGVIVSDYNAIAELIQHGVAADLAQAAALALKAGVDIDMMAGAYRHGLPIALDRGWVSSAEIDDSVRRVLTLKLRLGLFDDPYRRGGAAPRARGARIAPPARAQRRRARHRDAEERRRRSAAARRFAAPGGARSARGCRGRNARPLVGCRAGRRVRSRVVAGLRAALAGGEVLHTRRASTSMATSQTAWPTRSRCVRGRMPLMLCLGEAAAMSGEAASRAHLGLPGTAAPVCRGRVRRRAGAAQAGDRRPVLGPPAAVPWLVERAGRRARRLVPGQRGGQCDCGRHHRQGRPERPHAGQLAARVGTGAAVFRANVRAAVPPIPRTTSPASISTYRTSRCSRSATA